MCLFPSTTFCNARIVTDSAIAEQSVHQKDDREACTLSRTYLASREK